VVALRTYTLKSQVARKGAGVPNPETIRVVRQCALLDNVRQLDYLILHQTICVAHTYLHMPFTHASYTPGYLNDSWN